MKKVTIRDLNDFFENNLSKSVKNKKKLNLFYLNKMEYLTVSLYRLNDINYKIKKYNIFIIYEPKLRIIMSLDLIDKLVNHYFTTTVLIPIIDPILEHRNVATRKNKGTKAAIKYIKKDIEYFKKHNTFYYLKLDISKFFYNIDHEILKNMLYPLLDNDDFIRVCNIIDSTDEKYINNKINTLVKDDIPTFKYGKSLPIGNLSSQCLSIFYLDKLDKYIIHKLNLPHLTHYMDDFVIFSNDKEKLKKALKLIREKLKKEFKLELNNKKTFISNMSNGLNFLGYNFKVINNKTIVTVRKESYKKIKKNVKKINYLFDKGIIPYSRYFATISNYTFSYKASITKIRNYIDRNI